MVQRLDAGSADFHRVFNRLLAAKREVSEDVDQAARAIIEDVIARGDAALIDYTERFDGLALDPEHLAISAEEIDAALAKCDDAALDALALAKERIETFHTAQRPADWSTTDSAGVTLG